MKANKLIIACAAAVVLSSLGIAEEASGMNDTTATVVSRHVDRMPLYDSFDISRCRGQYTGDVVGDDTPHGKGKADFAGGDIYEGEFEYGTITGNGKYTTASDGRTYEGKFSNGILFKCRIIDKNGKVDELEKCHITLREESFGTWYTADKEDFTTAIPEHVNNRPLFDKNVRCYGRYTGDLIVNNDLPHGKGKLDFSDGDIYEGEFEYGTITGNGKYTTALDGRTYEGKFYNGVLFKCRIIDKDGKVDELEKCHITLRKEIAK